LAVVAAKPAALVEDRSRSFRQVNMWRIVVGSVAHLVHDVPFRASGISLGFLVSGEVKSRAVREGTRLDGYLASPTCAVNGGCLH
jgi:hypothetical protein